MRTKILKASQIAFLLSRKVSEAKAMIAHINEDEELETVSVDQFEKAYSHYPIRELIKSIENDYLKPGATRGYIMDYPQKKINASKKLLTTIRIPNNIRSFLSEEQIREILYCWEKRYGFLKIYFS